MKITLHAKLRQLGSQNWIVDDWKSDFNEFGQWLFDDLDFKVQISFQFNDQKDHLNVD